MPEASGATAFSVTANTYGEGRDIARRFAEPAMVGPMASPRAEVIARSIVDLMDLDEGVRVMEPVVPIEPIGMTPDYEASDRVVRITTTVDKDTLFDIFRANDDAVHEAAERTM
jgi:hypothetical protein